MPPRSSFIGASDRPARSGTNRAGLILKACIFATGCAGIVAEFVLSTLATYLTGNAVFQWTIVMSLMLFAMGLGSRLSKRVEYNLLDVFIIIEFFLSILCGASSALAYGLAIWTTQINLLIYTLAVIIGALIGFEIPLVTRLNQDYEELRANIANIMEKDYYGALLGGLFFAFFALPYLGLTYTPIALGAINFIVASLLFFTFRKLTSHKRLLSVAFGGCALFLAALTLIAEPVILYGEQSQFKDKVILARQTRYQKIVMTRYQDNYWLYINAQQQFSTVDEEKYHEPLVHPAMSLTADPSHILILGGGDGLALREIIKHPEAKSVTMIDLDPEMTGLARDFPILRDINKASMSWPGLVVKNEDAAQFMREQADYYGAIIVDLPDPDTTDLAHLYSVNFYHLLKRHLSPGGVIVTQAASPYFARRAFQCIVKTMKAAGLTVVPYHNNVPTMGEWGWVLGVSADLTDPETLKRRLESMDFEDVPTRFLNQDAMIGMLHFGKDVFPPGWEDGIQVNTRLNPVINRYYRSGPWAVY